MTWTGIPAAVDSTLISTTVLDEAASLICDSLTTDWISLGHYALRKWGKKNRAEIVELEKEIKRYGYFIVMAIHSTKRCHIKYWSNRSRQVSVTAGLSTELLDVASAQVGGTQTVSEGLSNWISCPDKDEEALILISVLNL